MPHDFQLAVDAARPHELAGWWAETLGWTVEIPDRDFIARMIAEGYATEAETMTWNGNLVWVTGAAIRHPGGLAAGPGSRIIFQQVPEAKAVKNRWHIDVRMGGDGMAAAVKDLTGRGATYLREGQQGPHRWITMADPEGNEFCIG